MGVRLISADEWLKVETVTTYYTPEGGTGVVGGLDSTSANSWVDGTSKAKVSGTKESPSTFDWEVTFSDAAEQASILPAGTENIRISDDDPNSSFITNNDTLLIEFLDVNGNVISSLTGQNVQGANTFGGGGIGDFVWGEDLQFISLNSAGNEIPNPAAGDVLIAIGPLVANYLAGDTHTEIDNSDTDLFLLGDNIITGTSGGDSIGGSFVDDDNEVVDGSDAVGTHGETVLGNDDSIQGNGGDDTIDPGVGNDTIDGGADNDSITATGDNLGDTILGGSGNDTITAGAGSDTIDGGTDNDSINAGIGNDTVDGGDGDDTIFGGRNNDVLSGGTGSDVFVYTNQSFQSDTVTGGEDGDGLDVDVIDTSQGTTRAWNLDLSANGSGDNESGTLSVIGNAANSVSFTEIERVVLDDLGDSVIGSTSNDTIDGLGGDDTINSGAGEDSIEGGAGNDIITNTSGNTTISGGTGDDTITGGGSRDSIDGGDDNDEISGGSASDTINGDGGDDSIAGEIGNDIIDGGAGNDTIVGGANTDRLTGGTGNDLFLYTNGDGVDTIFDFNTNGEEANLRDGDTTNNDYLDLTAFYNDLSEAIADYEADGRLDNATKSGVTIDISLNGAASSVLTTDSTGLVCFASGTMIETIRGNVRIEELTAGDMVRTMANGFKPITWIGRRELDAAHLDRSPKHRPIRIRAGALGLNQPAQDLYVSPQHRMLVNSEIVKRMFGEEQVLVPAVKLLEIDGIDVVTDSEGITYWHMLFDCHEVVFANGALSESLFTGPEAIKGLSQESLEEIFELMPEVFDIDYRAVSDLPLISGKKAQTLAQRHAKNQKPLVRAILPKKDRNTPTVEFDPAEGGIVL